MLIEVICDAELGSARIREADLDVLILVVGKYQIGEVRTHAVAVWHEPTPSLAAHDLPVTAFQVHPAKAETESVPVHDLIDIRCIVTAEIRFAVALHIIGPKFASNAHVETGILPGEAILAQLPLRSVAEGYGAEVRGNIVLGVRGAVYVFQIHEPAGSDSQPADIKASERPVSLSGILRRRLNRRTRAVVTANGLGTGCSQGRVDHLRRPTLGAGGGGLCGTQLLPQRFNLLLLRSHLALRL